jgi:chromate reductase
LHFNPPENLMAESSKTIAVVVGSIRKESINKKLARALEKMLPAGYAFKHIRIDDLPLYNQDTEQNPGEAVTRLREEIKACAGVIFVTPEYNRSYPGVLKNAIDHGSRPWGKSVWAGKPAGVIGIAAGAIGTALAQQHLRNVLTYLDMPTLNQPEAYLQAKEGFFTADGGIGEASREFAEKWLAAYLKWLGRCAA